MTPDSNLTIYHMKSCAFISAPALQFQSAADRDVSSIQQTRPRTTSCEALWPFAWRDVDCLRRRTHTAECDLSLRTVDKQIKQCQWALAAALATLYAEAEPVLVGLARKTKPVRPHEGGFLPRRKLHCSLQTHRKERRAWLSMFHFCVKKQEKKKKRPRQLPSFASPQISRRFLSCFQHILTFFSIPSSPSRGISCRDVTSAPRSAVHSLTHSHAHLLESIHDRKSAVSHLRNCRQVLSLPPYLPLSLSLFRHHAVDGGALRRCLPIAV